MARERLHLPQIALYCWKGLGQTGHRPRHLEWPRAVQGVGCATGAALGEDATGRAGPQGPAAVRAVVAVLTMGRKHPKVLRPGQFRARDHVPEVRVEHAQRAHATNPVARAGPHASPAGSATPRPHADRVLDWPRPGRGLEGGTVGLPGSTRSTTGRLLSENTGDRHYGPSSVRFRG